MFSAGTLVERIGALRTLAQASTGQAASLVALATELTAEADSCLRQLSGSPVTGMAITADNAGLHFAATAAVAWRSAERPADQARTAWRPNPSRTANVPSS